MSAEMMAWMGTVRGVVAGGALLAFIVLCLWVYSAGRRTMFEAAALLPLDDDRDRNDIPRSKPE